MWFRIWSKNELNNGRNVTILIEFLKKISFTCISPRLVFPIKKQKQLELVLSPSSSIHTTYSFNN